MADIVWRNDVRRLGDLVPWEHNPKRMGKKAGEGLHISLEKFGYALPMLVSPNNDLYDGHQRLPLLKKMLKEYGPDATVDVRVSSRPLTDDERRELVVRLKQNQAGWDFDMLPNLYEREELLEWTMIAAENTGRVCRAIEMAVDYLPVILERMQAAFPGIVIERVE